MRKVGCERENCEEMKAALELLAYESIGIICRTEEEAQKMLK